MRIVVMLLLALTVGCVGGSASVAQTLSATEAPSAQQHKNNAGDKPKKHPVRKIMIVDPAYLELANELDNLRAKMGAENKRHYDEVSIIRDQMKIATEKMIAYRKLAREKKQDKAADTP